MGTVRTGSMGVAFFLALLGAVTTAPAATGRIEAAADVSRTGAFNYQIPIWAPPGPRGIQPNLAVVYDSTAGEDQALAGAYSPDAISLGPGWSLGGLSMIHRCPRNAASDPSTWPAGPLLITTDALCINGRRLRVTSGFSTNGQDGSTYQTELADFSLITAHGTTGFGPTYFTVRSKDGVSYEFGNTADSRILLPNQSGNQKVRVWLLNKVSSAAANYAVTYWAGDSGSTGIGLPQSIQWSPTSSGSGSYQYTMSFAYTARGALEQVIGYASGQKLVNGNLLSGITIRQGSTVARHYNFSYATSPTSQRSRLQSVRECTDDSLTNCLGPTTLSYVQGALGVSASAGTALTNVTDVIGAHDFNGDGRADILYNAGGTLYVAFASGSGFQAGQSTGLAVTSSDRYDVADVVGSGRNDIFITRSGLWWRYYWTGSGFTGVATNVQWFASPDFDYMELADYNGDGLPDLVTMTTEHNWNYGGEYYRGWIRVRLNTSVNGNVSFSATEAALQTPECTLTFQCHPHVLAPRPWSQPRDLNADGRPDLLLGVESIGLNRVESQRYALVANGTSYDVTYSLAYTNAIGYLKWNDDRCADVVTADGTITNGSIIIAACDGLPAQTLPFAGGPVGVVDWNADGRMDVLVKNGSILSVYQSTGGGISARIDTSISSADKVFPLEVDGDGLPDVLIASGTSPYNVTYRLHNDVGSLADHLSAVTDGFGVTTNVSYVSITAGHYTRGSGPAPGTGEEDWLAPYWVVGSITSADGIGGTYTQTFDYAGARRDRQRGFSGFQMKQVIDSRTQQVRRTHYDTLFPRTGMVRREELFKPGGTVLISSVDTNNTHVQLDSTQYTERYFAYASTITSKTYDIADTTSSQEPVEVRTVEMLDPPDAYGNFGRVQETLADKDTDSPFYNQSWTTLITTGYTPNTANWCVGEPTGVTVAKTAPGQPMITRRISYGVDYANCRASSVTIEPGSSYELTRTLGFDAFGNVESETVSGTGVPSRTTSIGWGATGQFPETITDPIGSTANYRVRTGYDYAKGVRSSEVIESLDGATRNSPATSWSHDEFGRVLRQTQPDNTSVRWTYADCTSGCFNSNHRVTVTTSAYDANGVPISDQLAYLDRLGRPLVTREKLLDGTYNQVERQYDALGRLQRQSMPCSASGCALYWITSSYDDINRLTQVSRPVKENIPTPQTTTIEYLGRTTVVTDAQQKVTRKTVDVAGLLRKSEDHSGYFQTFTYDSFGSVTGVTDSASRTLFSATYEYGVGAFQRTRTDRSLGGSTSTFNALGEMQTYTDAKNQTFAMTYDALSRPLTRRDRVTGATTQESKTIWTWGQNVALHNVGQLQGVSFDSTDGAYSEVHSYDGLARPAQRDISMPGEGTYTYNFGYDVATGALDTLTYPVSTASSRLTVRYCYQNGYLQKVADSTCSGTAFWQATAMNSRGQLTNETLGNGIITQRAFDAVTGWVSSIKSGTSGNSTSAQNEAYLFDRVGNLTQRQNNRLGLTEDFYYDDLYRLDYSNLANSSGTGQNLDLTYQDALGDIQSRTEAGYTAPAVDQTIEWTSFNYPKRITATVLGGTQQIATFAYGPERARWRMVYESNSTMETTLYIGGMMEKVTIGTAADYRHYIFADGNVVAISSRKSSGTNTVHYVLTDHQGSVSSLLTDNGPVNESFTAYGNRRDAASWLNPPPASDLTSMNSITRQAYTGHTALGSMGLNHMNGRVQDAITGTFLSPDPYVAEPGDTQGFNRYAYVNNSPLTFTDPSGFDPAGIDCIFLPGNFSVLNYGGTTTADGQHIVRGDLPTPGSPCEFVAIIRSGSGRGIAAGVSAFLFPNITDWGERGVKGTWGDFAIGAYKASWNLGQGMLRMNPIFSTLPELEVGIADEELSGAAAFEIIGTLATLGRGAEARAAAAGESRLIGFCFAPGTLVQTFDGPKPIEDVQVDDWVWSWDEASRALVLADVVRTFARSAESLVSVTVEGTLARETIRSTREHPYWTPRGWVAAQSLTPEDLLLSSSGDWLQVVAVVVSGSSGNVYNFEVRGTHTYFVGQQGALVHNASRMNLRLGKQWAARNIADEVCRNGCDAVARQIQQHIGGSVATITPREGNNLGKFRGKSWGWGYHKVVVKNGRVYDLTTGHQGLAIDEYKRLWEYADAINFGF